MGDGTEILLWLLVMAIIAIRGAAQNRRRAMQREAEKAQREGRVGGRDVESRPGAVPGGAAKRGTAAKRTGLLDRMMEYATELERQAREQEAEIARRAAARDAPERTVVVPGRRVIPTRVEAPARPVAERPVRTADDIALEPDAELTRPWRTVGSRARAAGRLPSRAAEVPTIEEPATGVRRVHRPGLARLDRFPPLKRAIMLAEVLGRPPGFDGVGAVERRWSEDRTGQD